MISEYAGMANWALDIGKSVAAIFGWSKPTMTAASHSVVRRNFQNFPNSDGVSNAVNMGLIHNN